MKEKSQIEKKAEEDVYKRQVLTSIIGKDFYMPKNFVHARNANGRVAMGLHGYRKMCIRDRIYALGGSDKYPLKIIEKKVEDIKKQLQMM